MRDVIVALVAAIGSLLTIGLPMYITGKRSRDEAEANVKGRNLEVNVTLDRDILADGTAIRKELREQVDRQGDRIDDLFAQLQALHARLNDVTQERDTLRMTVGAQGERIKHLEDEVAVLKAENDRLRGRRATDPT